MIRFLADENFNRRIIQGVCLRLPEIDIVRVQDSGLRSFRDPEILEYAASQGRVVLSHDVATMKDYAIARVDTGRAMSGLILMHQGVTIGLAIDEIVLIAICARVDEWINRIEYVPL